MTEMRARSKWIDGFRSAVDNFRGHAVVVDLPPEKGGIDTGATALELAVMALAGCISTIYAVVAKKRKVKFSSLEVDVKAIPKETEMPISKVEVTVKVKSEHTYKELETVLELTMRICPVGAIFKAAGIEVKPEVKKI